MSDIVRQALYELRSFGNIIHGPEFWVALPLLMLAALISAVMGYVIFDHWEDDDS